MSDRLISGARAADGTEVNLHRSAALVGLGVLGLLLGTLALLMPDSARFTGLGAGLCAIGATLMAQRLLARHDATSHKKTPAPQPSADKEQLQTQVRDLQGRIDELEASKRARQESIDPLSLGGANTSLRGSADQSDSLMDRGTGLFSEGYFKVALDARIAAARRRLRPVSVVLVDVVQGLNTASQAVGDPLAVTRAIRATLREADTAARLNDGRFALVLEDTPENGAIWTIERLRTELVEDRPDHTVWAGVACYPAHAFDTAEILLQADQALMQAREWHQDRIEIASTD